MKIIDKYLIREIGIPILFSLYILVFLFLVADLFDHLSELITNKVPLGIVLQYYAYLIPFAVVETISWATLFGTIFVFSSMTKHGEIITLKACGLKITKIASPIVFLGIVIAVFTFAINDHIVPHTYHKALEIKKDHIELNAGTTKNNNIIYNATLLSGNRQYFVKKFDPSAHTLEDIRIHMLNDDKSVKAKLVAQSAVWKNNAWLFSGVSVYNLARNGRVIGEPEVAKEKAFPEFAETPKDFIEASLNTTFLSSKELKKHIDRLASNELNINAEQAALHQKRAFPWQSFVIMIITIPILGRSGNVRGTLAKKVLLCLIVVFCFHVLTAVSLALVNTGVFFPLLGAWFANIALTVIGAVLINRADY